MHDLTGQVIAVTGAVGGIGSSVCEVLEASGALVYRLDLGLSGARRISCDVTDPDSVTAARASILADTGQVDGLVCVAGVVEDDVPAEEMSVEQFDQVLGVNLRGVFLCCRAFGQAFLEQGAGRIVNVSSMSGSHVVNTPQKQCAYNASKAGVTALTKSLAVEWVARGVRVNAISPGYVSTPLLARKQHQFDGWLAKTPQGRMAEPAEIAATIAFLLSDDASYFCGAELVADGGYSLT